jgi:hypothetical protein
VDCDAHIRPFLDATELVCKEVSDSHSLHSAVLRDYARPGSETAISWNDLDRRTFHGDWPGECHLLDPARCVLPRLHRGRCEP